MLIKFSGKGEDYLYWQSTDRTWFLVAAHRSHHRLVYMVKDDNLLIAQC